MSRSHLRYAATAKRRWERDIVHLLALRKWAGTAFGTARLVEFALSADDALLFRPIGPVHHRGQSAGLTYRAKAIFLSFPFLSFQMFKIARLGDHHLSYLTRYNIEVPSKLE